MTVALKAENVKKKKKKLKLYIRIFRSFIISSTQGMISTIHVLLTNCDFIYILFYKHLKND